VHDLNWELDLKRLRSLLKKGELMQDRNYILNFRVGLGDESGIYYEWQRNWGVDISTPKKLEAAIARGEQRYADEWAAGDEQQLQYVVKASETAGFGDYPALLNDHNAKVVAEAVRRIPGDLTILDIGAGPGNTTLAIYKALDNKDKQRVHFILFDPSAKALEKAKTHLNGEGVSYETYAESDLSIPGYVPAGSVDIATGVASIHHHPKIPFTTYAGVLKWKGIFTSADWHNSMWEHPNRVYGMLKRMGHTDEELADFIIRYPNALESTRPIRNIYEEIANKDIENFWLGYAQIRTEESVSEGKNSIWMLEGHVPPQIYVEAMEDTGLSTNDPELLDIMQSGLRKYRCYENPHRILLGSGLLYLIGGRKI